jgi:UDP-4-amino-4,6-dideoxy-N-acetyl-beta-L-altrosamine N-acetyltransferase
MEFKRNTNIEIQDVLLKNFINLSDDEKEMVRCWRNNENVKQWMYQDHIISPEEHMAFMRRTVTDERNVYYLLQHKDGEYLGVLGLNRIDHKNKSSFFGLYSNPNSKRLGIGRILDKIAIELTFNHVKLHSLHLEILENNFPVINLHKKFGFQEEGRLKEFVYRNGRWIDVIIMGIVNERN